MVVIWIVKKQKLYQDGGIKENAAPDDTSFSIRPVFYLSSNVKYLGGSGIPRQQPITISY